MTRTRLRTRGYALTLAAAVAGATLAGGLIGPTLLGSQVEGEVHQRLREYTDLLDAAAQWAPERLETEELVYSSIDGMIRTLDPHSSFLAPRAYSEMQDRQKGSFYGLGILVTKRNNQVTVITPLEGTPASRLGIRAGDIIAEVEDEPTDEMSLDDVVSRLKGAKGTPVNIKIKRVGIEEMIPMTIIREAIPTNSISYALMLGPDVGYIRIKDFTRTTVRELDESVAKLRAAGMKKLLLDLRSNPGGLLDAAVGVTDHFVEKGDMIVYTRGRTPDSFQEFRAPGTHMRLNVPLVVLINRGSASASEIIAGAVQDHDRGLVIGTTSWGKGLVQSVYTLQYGAGLALTTSKYFTPAGRNIQRDYTSVYDYYVADGSGRLLDEVDLSEREVFLTNTGRKVYGGGGITPDVIVEPRELSRTLQLLEVRSTIFNFGVDYYSRHPELNRDMKVTPAIVEEFIAFADKREIAPGEDVREAIVDPADRTWLERALQAEIIAAKFGFDASYPYRLRGDDQVSRALQLFPEAEKLAARAAAARSEMLAREERGSTSPSTASGIPKSQ
ncbi:MAG TPA: S41 family peptidase [Thermoanaerobaculia bacterium]|nr:S41 family peptidase [Thermoanaerobaculia bacterium]